MESGHFAGKSGKPIMKHGTVLRNMWQPSYESLLIYQGVEGNYAKVIWIINGVVHYGHKFYKRDIYEKLDEMVERGEMDESEAMAELRDYIQERKSLYGER